MASRGGRSYDETMGTLSRAQTIGAGPSGGDAWVGDISIPIAVTGSLPNHSLLVSSQHTPPQQQSLLAGYNAGGGVGGGGGAFAHRQARLRAQRYESGRRRAVMGGTRSAGSAPAVVYNEERRVHVVRNYVLGDVLGEGAYGKVREAIHARSLRRVAIKAIKLRRLKKVFGRSADTVRPGDV